MTTELMNETHAMAGPSNCLTRLKAIIRELSALAEFCLILLVGFGPLMVFVLPNLLRPKPVMVNNAGVLWFPLIELMLLIPVLWIGKLRGWSLSTFGSKICFDYDTRHRTRRSTEWRQRASFDGVLFIK